MVQQNRIFIERQFNIVREELATASSRLKKAELLLASLRVHNLNLFEENDRLQKEVFELRKMLNVQQSDS